MPYYEAVYARGIGIVKNVIYNYNPNVPPILSLLKLGLKHGDTVIVVYLNEDNLKCKYTKIIKKYGTCVYDICLRRCDNKAMFCISPYINEETSKYSYKISLLNDTVTEIMRNVLDDVYTNEDVDKILDVLDNHMKMYTDYLANMSNLSIISDVKSA